MRVLVAGRGAPAVRAAESCRALGLEPVTVVARSDPQRRHVTSGHLTLDDDSCAGYDCVDCIVGAAVDAGVEVVHPGSGGIAEDPRLGRSLAERGIGFAGPPPEVLDIVGDRGLVADAAHAVGVPTLPHASGEQAVRDLVARLGLPIALKDSDSLYGDGVRIIQSDAELAEALASGTRPYAERFVDAAQVIGVTVAVDDDGNAAVLGERETLLVAHSRKLLEATPVLGVPETWVRAMRGDALRLVRVLGLRNLATVEFLAHAGGYAFLEMNARLTGGYRVCEAQAGLDLIALQVELALGRRPSPQPPAATRQVHAVQAHLFIHSRPRLVTQVRLPAPRPGVLVDCVLEGGRPVAFDVIGAQVLATGSGRGQACRRVGRAVAGLELAGLPHAGPEIVQWCSHRYGAATREGAT